MPLGDRTDYNEPEHAAKLREIRAGGLTCEPRTFYPASLRLDDGRYKVDYVGESYSDVLPLQLLRATPRGTRPRASVRLICDTSVHKHTKDCDRAAHRHLCVLPPCRELCFCILQHS